MNCAFMYLYVLLGVILAHTVTSNLLTKLFTSKDSAQSSPKKLLPKLLPHEDSQYLIEFHADNTDYVDQMEPVLKRLEEDLDTKIRRINVSRRQDLPALLEVMGHDECGNFPFYYNRRTGQAVCGPTTYKNLKAWGTGAMMHSFMQAPENIHEQEFDKSKQRKVGMAGFWNEKFGLLSSAGRARANEETRKLAEERNNEKDGKTES